MHIKTRNRSLSKIDQFYNDELSHIKQQLVIVHHQIFERLQEKGFSKKISNVELQALKDTKLLTPLEIEEYNAKYKNDAPYLFNNENRKLPVFGRTEYKEELIELVYHRLANYYTHNVDFETNISYIVDHFNSEDPSCKCTYVSESFCIALKNYLWQRTQQNEFTKLKNALNQPFNLKKITSLLKDNSKECLKISKSANFKNVLNRDVLEKNENLIVIDYNFRNRCQVSAISIDYNDEKIAKIQEQIKNNEFWKCDDIPDFFSCLEIAYILEKNYCFAITSGDQYRFTNFYCYLYFAIPFLHVAPLDDPEISRMISLFKMIQKRTPWAIESNVISDSQMDVLLTDDDLYAHSNVYDLPWSQSTPLFWRLAYQKYANPLFKIFMDLFSNPI